ncbi:MAG: fibronectin type III domain-containing protein, partial [Deinococcus sp.]|nr:fibronectin type III domain-containing protein [Deinococcus sp.]
MTRVGPAGVLFDDFSYASSTDPYLGMMGWRVVDGLSGPPSNAQYSRSLVSFAPDSTDPSNRLMLLQATTQNTLSSMRLSRIETAMRFLEGTYAARVFFENSARTYRDGNVQTFYLINNHPPGNLDYAEADFEYLPYDVWNPPTYSTGMWMTTWETAPAARSARTADLCQENSYRTTCLIPEDHSGWHTLLIQVDGGAGVLRYFIDGTLVTTAGGQFYTETLMNISFSNWVIDGLGSPGSSTSTRTYSIMADWVFHAQDVMLTPTEIEALVAAYRSTGIIRQDTTGGQPQPASGLGAVASGSNRVNLSWQDNASNETGFKIERKTTGTWSQIATTGANLTSYQDTSLIAGTTYWYRVRAYNEQGDSIYSNEAQATTP